MIPRQPAGVPVFGCCSTFYAAAPRRRRRVRVSTASMVPIPPDHVERDLKDERACIVLNSLLDTPRGLLFVEERLCEPSFGKTTASK